MELALAWYVVRTKPWQEQQSAIVLGQRGIEVYLPLSQPVRRRRAGERPEVLFPGYLFARLDCTADDWLRARSAPGVAYFLGGVGGPTPLPDELIEEIRRGLANRQSPRTQPLFKQGQQVVIVGGPLAGLEAVFQAGLSGSGRSRILVEIVGRIISAEINVGHLRSA